jgi:phytoene synthase
VTRRAHTTTAQKLGGVSLGVLRTGFGMVMPRPSELFARPEPEIAFLVQAAATAPPARESWAQGRSGALVSALATLEAQDRAARAALIGRDAHPT